MWVIARPSATDTRGDSPGASGGIGTRSTRPATQAAGIIKGELGLPAQAFSYLTSHGSLDIEHIAFYEKLMNRLDEPADKAAVVHTAKVVYRLYGDMFRSLPLAA